MKNGGWIALGVTLSGLALLRTMGAPRSVSDYTVRKKDGLYFVIDEASRSVLFAPDASAQKAISKLLNGLVANGHDATDRAVHNYSITCDGSGAFADAWPLHERLDFPPMQNCVFDARSVTFVEHGLRFDSFMECDIQLGVVAGQTNGICLEFSPRTPGPDGLTVIVDSRFQCSAIVGQGTRNAGPWGPMQPVAPGTIGVLFNTRTQSITRCYFTFVNTHGFARGMYAPNPGPGFVFQGNKIAAGSFFDNLVAIQDGDPENGGNLNNTWTAYLERNFWGDHDIDIYGAKSTWNLSGQHDPDVVAVLQPGAHHNLITGTVPPASIINRSGNTNNRVLVSGYRDSYFSLRTRRERWPKGGR